MSLSLLWSLTPSANGCNKNGLDMDAKARNRFAIEVAERSMSPKH
jgi:hypothetical protein